MFRTSPKKVRKGVKAAAALTNWVLTESNPLALLLGGIGLIAGGLLLGGTILIAAMGLEAAMGFATFGTITTAMLILSVGMAAPFVLWGTAALIHAAGIVAWEAAKGIYSLCSKGFNALFGRKEPKPSGEKEPILQKSFSSRRQISEALEDADPGPINRVRYEPNRSTPSQSARANHVTHSVRNENAGPMHKTPSSGFWGIFTSFWKKKPEPTYQAAYISAMDDARAPTISDRVMN